jgi:uncharacterized phiE125 gp8 family phage protein
MRITHTSEDTYYATLIAAAREYAEFATQRQLVTATWKLYLDEFPYDSGNGYAPRDGQIVVPYPPLASVTSIEYVDTAGASQTLSASLYTVDSKTQPGRIVPSFGNSWPSVRSVANAVTVTYVAGYGAAAAVPAKIKHAIKLLVAHLNEMREPFVAGTIVSDVPMSVEMLLDALRVKTVGQF